MVSEKYKFCFIHIPKTGGNSIQNSLARYSEDRVVCLNNRQDGVERFEIRREGTNLVKHSTLLDYQREIPSGIFAELTTFTVIRNPWDRVISFYFSPHRGDSIEWSRQSFLDVLELIRPDEEYLCIGPKAQYDIKRFLRFENLQQDFSSLLQELCLPNLQLPQRNRSQSKATSDYRAYFDEELREIVSVKFRRTIESFGYEFE